MQPSNVSSQSTPLKENVRPFPGKSKPSVRTPAKGQIWKGRDYDGITEYEVLILNVDEAHVHYVLVYNDQGPVWTFTTPISFFLAIYGYERIPPWPTLSTQQSQTPSQKRWSFFTGLRNLWGRVIRAIRHGF